eukprot:9495942-Pyramimonas_sp.AAC.1
MWGLAFSSPPRRRPARRLRAPLQRFFGHRAGHFEAAAGSHGVFSGDACVALRLQTRVRSEKARDFKSL